MLAGYLPFDEPTNDLLFQRIREAKVEYPIWIDKDARNIINKILNPNPANRATISDIKYHYWNLKQQEESPLIFSKEYDRLAVKAKKEKEQQVKFEATKVTTTVSYSSTNDATSKEKRKSHSKKLIGDILSEFDR